MLTKSLVSACELGLVPDGLARAGMRHLLRKRLAKEDHGSSAANERATLALVEEFSRAPIALVPEKANEQHYEVSTEFYLQTLGTHRKYSCCYWPKGCTDLNEAESHALLKTCQHADLENGQSILELGCGWGSLTLWMARHYPAAKIVAVSNSNSQRQFIQQMAKEAGVADRVDVLTCDMNDFSTDQKFDRVVSVEMFEHMRNHAALLKRVSTWLAKEGRLLVHIFCHRSLTYEFQDRGTEDWLSRHFFSGGIMPAADYLLRFQEDLVLEQQWAWAGGHYRRTCDAWLGNMDRRKGDILPILKSSYGAAEAKRSFHRWRMFHMACSELFGHNDGNEWFVSHYRFKPRLD